MKLFIDTSDNTKTIVGLDDDFINKPTGVDKSQQVLSLINEILRNNKKTLKDIAEIKVETGAGLPAGRQGSFTGLRVGVAVANVLGWVLRIPVNGKRINKSAIIEPLYE